MVSACARSGWRMVDNTVTPSVDDGSTHGMSTVREAALCALSNSGEYHVVAPGVAATSAAPGAGQCTRA